MSLIFGNLGPIGGTDTATIRNDGVSVQGFAFQVVLAGLPTVTYPGQSAKLLGSFPIAVNGPAIAPGTTVTRTIIGFPLPLQDHAGANFAGFLGLGSVTFPIAVATNIASQLLPSQTVVLDYSVALGMPSPRIVYIYDSVPEPGTWTAGAMALLFIARRRR